jgi:hypothetical protein
MQSAPCGLPLCCLKPRLSTPHIFTPPPPQADEPSDTSESGKKKWFEEKKKRQEETLAKLGLTPEETYRLESAEVAQAKYKKQVGPTGFQRAGRRVVKRCQGGQGWRSRRGVTSRLPSYCRHLWDGSLGQCMQQSV